MAVLRLDHNSCSSDFMLHLFLTLVYSGDYCEVNLCHNEGTCVTGVGDDPFICICADGFAGDTCNLTETGDEKSSFLDYKYKQLCQNIKQTSFFLSFSQDPAALTPVRTMGCVRSSLRAEEEMFSMDTSASASLVSKECTVRPVSFFWL